MCRPASGMPPRSVFAPTADNAYSRLQYRGLIALHPRNLRNLRIDHWLVYGSGGSAAVSISPTAPISHLCHGRRAPIQTHLHLDTPASICDIDANRKRTTVERVNPKRTTHRSPPPAATDTRPAPETTNHRSTPRANSRTAATGLGLCRGEGKQLPPRRSTGVRAEGTMTNCARKEEAHH